MLIDHRFGANRSEKVRWDTPPCGCPWLSCRRTAQGTGWGQGHRGEVSPRCPEKHKKTTAPLWAVVFFMVKEW